MVSQKADFARAVNMSGALEMFSKAIQALI